MLVERGLSVNEQSWKSELGSRDVCLVNFVNPCDLGNLRQPCLAMSTAHWWEPGYWKQVAV